MSGAGAPDDATRRSGRSSPRMQSASVAVLATVVALVAALGVSVAATRRPQPGHDLTGVAAADLDASAPSGATVTVARHEPAATRVTPRRTGSPTPRTDAAGESSPPSAPAQSAGAAAGGSTATPPSTALGASSQSAGSSAPSTTFDLVPAGTGTWFYDAKIVDRTGLMAPNEQEAELRVTVSGDDAGGAQRHAVEPHAVSVVREVVRYDQPGRRSLAIDVATGGARPVRFASPDGFLLVPRVVSVGMRWAQSAPSDDGRTALDLTTAVVGIREVTVGADRTVDVVDVEQTLRLGGDHAMTITRRIAYAPELGLAVSLGEDAKGTNAAGSTLDRSVQADLTSTEPAPDSVAPTEPAPPTEP